LHLLDSLFNVLRPEAIRQKNRLADLLADAGAEAPVVNTPGAVKLLVPANCI
jgi:hypothetical protein